MPKRLSSHAFIDILTSNGFRLISIRGSHAKYRDDHSHTVIVPHRLKNLIPSQSIIRQIQSHHGHEIEQILGILPTALTANEANYLIGFRSADEIRNRLAKARQETDRRLRSKGIER